MNKKGDFFSEEAVKTVLAVIGIMILFALGIALFGIFTEDRAEAQAERILTELAAKAKSLEEGQVKDVVVGAPEDWWISAWPYKSEELMPDKCEGEYCLCICSDPFVNSKQGVVDACNEIGVCEDFEIPVKTYLESNSGIAGEIGMKLSEIFGLDIRNAPIIIKGVRNIQVEKKDGEVIVKL